MLYKEEVLVVHLGGLGDVCLSESVFLSLREHFGDCLAALGNRRFLDLFGGYFKKTQGVESRHWLYLFSERLTGPRWRRIVFIGKDRQELIRQRWKAYSEEEFIFIEMYPEGAFEPLTRGETCRVDAVGAAVHIEDYQLAQLNTFGIAPRRKTIAGGMDYRVILYPEAGFSKEKWPVENFVALFSSLKERGMEVVLLRPADLCVPLKETVFFEDLSEVKGFFGEGGLFISNDSGMAHLAGACGLSTVTIFTGFDPAIWHPRGRNISLKTGVDRIGVKSITKLISTIVTGSQ